MGNLKLKLSSFYGIKKLKRNETGLKSFFFASLTGVLKGDTLAYVPGNCDTFKSRTTCLTSHVGVKCVWNTKKDACETHPPNRAKSGIETCLTKKQVSHTYHHLFTWTALKS